jgi:hypothetical protein
VKRERGQGVRAKASETNQKMSERDLAQSFLLLDSRPTTETILTDHQYYVKDDLMECNYSGSNELISLKGSTE